MFKFKKNLKSKYATVIKISIGLTYVLLSFLYRDMLVAQTWSPIGDGTNNTVKAMASFYDELYAGGSFTNAGGITVNHIAKWTGNYWQVVSSGLDSEVTSLIVFNNELYAGGKFLNAGGTTVSYVAKWNGLTWSPVGNGFNGQVFSLIVYQNELYAGGNFTFTGTTEVRGIAKWSGTTWDSVGAGLSGGTATNAYAMTVFKNELIVAGDFSSAGGISSNNIARWNGVNWSSLGSGVDNYSYALEVYNDNLYVGGRFTSAGGNPSFFIAKWDSASWSPLETGVNNVVLSLATYKNELYVGGDFSTAGGATVNFIAKWNGSAWSDVGGGTNNRVTAFKISNNELYLGGEFTFAGGISANRIAKLSLLKKYRTFSANNLLAEKPNCLKVKRGIVKGYPNLSTAVANVFFHIGKKGTTFLGVQGGPAWLFFKSQSKFGDFFTIPHTGQAYPIDYVRSRFSQKKLKGAIKPTRKKFNNVAWEQGVIFKLNLFASQYGITPTGFDSLVVDSSATLASPYLKGKSLSFVGTYYDSIMTFYDDFGVNNSAAYALLQTFVDSVLRPINETFYSPIDTSAPDYNINAIEITGQKNSYAVYLKGVKTISGVKIIKEPSTKTSQNYFSSGNRGDNPSAFIIPQNFPNPFNPTTTISFELQQPSFVTLKVYNILGQVVSILYDNEFLDEGGHNVAFDAEKLTSGVYFYTIQTKDYSVQNRMILLK
ncbi:MAG: T9SS type A sorting domain-containing protein [Ignavibacteriales bacterium]|nr:T9SS type A sorting domain-containing protein [Ignavibacteriales bacterium]